MLLPNLAKDESSHHDSTNCSEISAVTWFRNCSGLLQVADRPHEIGACSGSKTGSAFCKICLPDLAQGYIHY